MTQHTFISKSALFVFIFILSIPLLSFSQGELTWFDAPRKVFLGAIEYHGDIYTITTSGKKGSLLIEKKTTNLSLLKKVNFKFKIDKKKPRVHKFLIFNDKLYVISIGQGRGNYTVYISKFDTKNLSLGETIFECKSAESRPIFGDANVVSAISPNGKYFVLTAIQKQKRKEPHFVDIYVFDENFNKIHQYKSDIEIVDSYRRYPTVKKVEVDNNGNVFFMTTENIWKKTSYTNATFTSITNEGKHKSTIQLKKGTALRDINFTILKNDIYIVGLYSESISKDKNKKNPVRGAFFAKKTKKGKAKLYLSYHPLSAEMLHSPLRGSTYRKLTKSGKIKEIENLRIKEVVPWRDNRILCITEVIYSKVQSSGNFSTEYISTKTIIALTYDLKGKLIWTNNIPKKTKIAKHSTFDQNFLYGSYFMDQKENEITFYYHLPPARGLDKSGKRIKPEKASISWTTMDYDTGKKEKGILELSSSLRQCVQIMPHRWFLTAHSSFLKQKYGILNAE